MTSKFENKALEGAQINPQDEGAAITGLVFKAYHSDKSEDAMRFSQAAVNAANAVYTLASHKALKA